VPTVFDSCHGSKRGNHDEDSYNGKVICDAEGATRNAGESDKNIKANGNSDRDSDSECAAERSSLGGSPGASIVETNKDSYSYRKDKDSDSESADDANVK
jgi:hypothetical protein